jgi:hypothetical protein
MDLLSIDELKTLTGDKPFPALTITMPTIRAGAETQQNSTRFKNLLRQVEDRLQSSGMAGEHAKKYLRPALDLMNDGEFWQHQSDGLVVYLTPEEFHHYRVPLNMEEAVILGGHYHLKPLLPLFSAQGQFYLMALSQDEVRLYKGTRFSVDEIEVKDMPESLADALQWDDPEKSLQVHDASWGPVDGGASDPRGIYHGHGAGKDDHKDRILRYFHQIANALEDFLGDDTAPLVLIGVDYLHPIYRQVNRYKHLLDESVETSPKVLGPEELHSLTWELVKPRFEADQKQASDLYHQQAGMDTGRAANDLSEIVLAAYQGRVEQLFVPLGVEQWGTVDWSSGEIEFHEEQTMENVDLYDLAAVQTLLNGGEVYAVAPEEISETSPSMAVLRY